MHAKTADPLWLCCSITLLRLTPSSPGVLRYSSPAIKNPSVFTEVSAPAVIGASCAATTIVGLSDPGLLIPLLFLLLPLQIRACEFPTCDNLRNHFDILFVTDLLNSPSARIKTLQCLLHLLGPKTVSPKGAYAPNAHQFLSTGSIVICCIYGKTAFFYALCLCVAANRE